MKMIVVDVPYGAKLALTGYAIDTLLDAYFVKSEGYGEDRVITRLPNHIELDIVDDSTFQEPKPSTFTIAAGSMPPPAIQAALPLTTDDITF